MLDQSPAQALAPQSGLDSEVVNPADSRLLIHEESDITGHLPGFLVLGHGQLAAWRVDVALDVTSLSPPPVAPGNRAQPPVEVMIDGHPVECRDGECNHRLSIRLA